MRQANLEFEQDDGIAPKVTASGKRRSRSTRPKMKRSNYQDQCSEDENDDPAGEESIWASPAVRMGLAAWVASESKLAIRGTSNDAFLEDLQDGVALCMILEKLGWLKEDEYNVECVTRAHMRQNLIAMRTSVALHDPDLGGCTPQLLNDYSLEGLYSVILPFLVELKDTVKKHKRAGAAKGKTKKGTTLKSDTQVKTRREYLRAQEEEEEQDTEEEEEQDTEDDDDSGEEEEAKIESALEVEDEEGSSEEEQSTDKDESADNDEESSEQGTSEVKQIKRTLSKIIKTELKRTTSEKSLVAEAQQQGVEEVLGSLFGLLIFFGVIFLILTFFGDLVGITDIGFARLLGIRGTVETTNNVDWFVDMERSW